MELKHALRQHSGLWKLSISNEMGSDEVEVEIVVLGKLEKPDGPLEISDVCQGFSQIKVETATR